MSISVCIVDDELDAQNVLLKLIEQSSVEFELLGVADSYESGKALLTQSKPNLVLLDINLGGKSGLDLAAKLDLSITTIVFITAYDNHVIDALRLKAFDYLFKPVFLDDFEDMIQRFLLDRRKKQELSVQGKILTITNNEGQHVLDYSEIEYLEASGAYCYFHLSSGNKIMVSKPLKYYADQLNGEEDFIRTHKTFLVNKAAIAKVIYGENLLQLKSGKIILLSRNQKSILKKALD